MNKYRIYFQLPVGMSAYKHFDTELGPASFKDGFWVNEKFQHASASDLRWWVPPSHLDMIEKVGE